MNMESLNSSRPHVSDEELAASDGGFPGAGAIAGGLRLARRAYKAWKKVEPVVDRLPDPDIVSGSD